MLIRQLSINQGFIMFRLPLIIVLVLIVKSDAKAKLWCPKDLLERLVICLYPCDRVTDKFEQLDCRMLCAKDNFCLPKPKHIFDRKMAMAREYSLCMIYCEANEKYKVDRLLCGNKCKSKLDQKYELIDHIDQQYGQFHFSVQ